DLLRAYAAEQADAEDSGADRHAARHRLLDHYLHTAQTVARLQYGPWTTLPLAPVQAGVTPEDAADATQANTWFGAEQRVLVAAVDLAAATAGLERYAWQLVWTLTYLFEARGLWPEWAAAQETALEA